MEQVRMDRIAIVCVFLVVGTLLGCTSQPAAAGTGDDAAAGVYAGALDLSYEGALDASTQLALGTLKLEGTENAVTEEQATALRPLWQALAGSALQGDAERSAVLRQIEALMATEQIAAIAGMRLTAQDLGTWARERGAGAPGRAGQGGGQPPGDVQGRPGAQGQAVGAFSQMSDDERATRRAEFQNAAPEALATRRAQFAQGGAGGVGPIGGQGSAGSAPMTAVIALLSERSGASATPAVARQRPSVTATSTPTPLPVNRETPTAEPAAAPTTESAPTATAAPTAAPTPTAVAMESSPTRAAAQPESTLAPAAAAYESPALEPVPDTDPGPPFAVEVSANRAYADPLVEQSRRYLVSGIVRNEGSETYSLSTLHVTFFNADGFRGSYRRFPGPHNMGGEWIWEGRTEADLPCLVLGPGQECPFIVEIAAQDMGSVLIHPDANVTERSAVSLPVGSLSLVRDGSQYVRIVGQVRNDHSSTVKNVVLSGVLLDAQGEIVALGSTYLAVAEGMAPGESVRFEIRIHDPTYSAQTPFVQFRVYAQAERD